MLVCLFQLTEKARLHYAYSTYEKSLLLIKIWFSAEALLFQVTTIAN